jgi:hypothetical protein
LAERFYFASFDVLRLSGLKMSDEVEEILDGDDVVRSLIEEVRRQKCLYSKSDSRYHDAMHVHQTWKLVAFASKIEGDFTFFRKKFSISFKKIFLKIFCLGE